MYLVKLIIQLGESKEAETMREMLVHEGWMAAGLLPHGWRWRQDSKVIATLLKSDQT